MDLGHYAGIVLDLDGVVIHSADALPGAVEAVERIRAAGTAIVFVTNNATRTPAGIADMLETAGVKAAAREVVTSPLATARLLSPGTACLVVGVEGLRSALLDRGCRLVEEPHDAEAVVVGFHPDLTYDDLRRATLAIRAGARFLATNPDRTFPAADGIWPGNGAIVAALVAATDVEPEVAGKPQRALFDEAAERLPRGRLCMVGDRIDTDLEGAAALGWDTALVLTGVTDQAALTASGFAPTHVAASLAELINA